MKKTTVNLSAKAILGLVILGIALVWFIYLPVSYDFDGTVFAQYLRHALVKNDLAATAQPQHPLYIPVNYLIYKGLNFIAGYNVLEYFHLQVFSLCFGLLTLLVSYKIIKELTEDKFYHFAGMVFIAFTYGIWYYSVEAEVHMAGLFFVAAGVYLLFFKRGDENLHRTLCAAFCFAMAAGFHLTNGLIAVSVLLIFIIEKKRFKTMVRFFSFYGLFLAVMLAVFVLICKVNLFAFFKNQFFVGDALAGYKISYWTSLSFSSLWGSITAAAAGLLIPKTSALSILSALLFFGALTLVIYSGVKLKNKKNGYYYLMLCWLLPYFIFFTFWDYRNTEFKLNVVLPFAILFIVSMAAFRNKIMKVVFALLTIAVFIANIYFFILPANDSGNNPAYGVAAAIGKVTPSDSIIVIGGCGSTLSIHNKIYISYFAHRRTFILDWMLGKGLSFAEIGSRLQQERQKGTPIFFFSDVTGDGETVRQIMKNHNLETGDYFNFLKMFVFKERIPLNGGYYLERL